MILRVFLGVILAGANLTGCGIKADPLPVIDSVFNAES